MVKLGPSHGSAREATIIGFNLNKATARVKLNLGDSDVVYNSSSEFDIPIPGDWVGPNGEFSGGCPPIGATLWVTFGQGGRWVPVSYVATRGTFSNTSSLSSSGHSQSLMSALKPGRWITQVNNNIRIIVDPIIGFQAGDPINLIHADPTRKIYSKVFDQSLEFTESKREVSGPIRRDLRANNNRNTSGLSSTSHIYDDSLFTIGLDPLTKTDVISDRNPPYTESREVIYEFSRTFGYTDPATESQIYDTDKIPNVSSTFFRDSSRSDVLSLSKVFPNQLIESVKGTLVDIYGNILDLNRSVLPSGAINSLSFRSASFNKSDIYNKLLEQNRKSVAFHFEINCKKPEPIQSVKENDNYAKGRSNFSIDVDKEGQFKINVPASSESGNVSLLTRYENYSTLIASENDSDPRKFVRNVDHQDIFIEGFGAQNISLKGNEEDIQGFASPVDRITGAAIKLGTAFHSFESTIGLHKRNDAISSYNENSMLLNIPLVTDLVSNEIIVSGSGANAGGRSGTISLDGSLSLSVGANTVDRQSVWLDCAGGVISNFGRDRFNRSWVAHLDGDMLVQIGSATVDNDSRFPGNNSHRAGVYDLRVSTSGGTMHVFRIDKNGVTVSTPGRLDFYSAQTMRFKSGSNMVFDAEQIYMYGDERGTARLVNKVSGETI